MIGNNAVILNKDKYTLGKIDTLKKCPFVDFENQIKEALKSKSNLKNRTNI